MKKKVVIVRLEVPPELWEDLTTRFAIRDALKILKIALDLICIEAQIHVLHPDDE